MASSRTGPRHPRRSRNACTRSLEDQRSTGNLTKLVQAVQYRYGLDTATAEDVVFDTLLAVCQKEDVQNHAAYFQQSLRNNAIKVRQKLGRCRFRSLDTTGDPPAAEPEEFTRSCDDDHLRVAAAYRQLPYDYQQWILWRVFENRTLEDIAARMGVTPKTAKARIDRALARLKANMNSLGIQ
ncbi:sigma-70 family RNA polymerase sigma factor [Myxococcota bacterium]|jgi:RNA polymerase sigma factor (sigma-70 family)|nr:sigma-70 family RNA polymerase sigma factor [Myxococcota bacterium]